MEVMCSSEARNQLRALVAYFSTLKMQAICSSETSIDFHLTTRLCNPERGTPPNSTKRSLNRNVYQTKIAEKIKHISYPIHMFHGFQGAKLKGD
jgi:hypothetical protein